ncbi:MAG: class I SAM-dependent methyltransferase, partial [Candidatus Methanomethylicia archaeon]
MKNYFNPFIKEKIENNFHLVFKINFLGGFSFNPSTHHKPLSSFFPIKVSEGIEFNEKRKSLFFSRKEIFGTLCFSKDIWEVEVNFKRNIFRHLSNVLFFSKKNTINTYYRFIARLIIQNLIFIRLKEKFPLFVLAGAGIVYNNRAYLFSGLPGSGKSTIVEKLTQNLPSAKIIADNYLLIVENRVLIFPERKVKLEADVYPIEKIFIIKHGVKFNVQKIEKENVLIKLLSINHYTHEFPLDDIFSSLPLVSDEFNYLNYVSHLQSIINKNEFYELTTDPNCDEFLDYFLFKVLEDKGELLNKVIKQIDSVSHGLLKSIYLVGINDSPFLCDFDLIVVLKEENSRIIKKIKKIKERKIDIKMVFTPESLTKKFLFLGYENYRCIYGEDFLEKEREKEIKENYKLAKFSLLFFTSFLRNYYKLLREKKFEPSLILKHLGDFLYVDFYLDKNEIPENLKKFIEKIKSLRKFYPNVKEEVVIKCLYEGINFAWDLVGILNEKLKKLFIVEWPRYLFLGRNSTIFLPSSVEKCRMLQEKSRLLWKFKILYLPLGFQCIFSKDEITSETFQKIKKPEILGIKDLVFLTLQKIIALFLYFKFLYKDFYNVFSPKEAFSVAQSKKTYSDKYFLLPSEKEFVNYLNLSMSNKILVLGCGEGREVIPLLKEGYEVIGLDFNEELIKSVKEKFPQYKNNFITGDVLNLSKIFSKETFDIVLFFYNGLDYLYPKENRKKALLGIFNVLKKEGFFVFSFHNILCINRKNLFEYLFNL